MLCLVGRNWLDRAYHYFLILATQECQNKKSRTMAPGLIVKRNVTGPLFLNYVFSWLTWLDGLIGLINQSSSKDIGNASTSHRRPQRCCAHGWRESDGRFANQPEIPLGPFDHKLVICNPLREIRRGWRWRPDLVSQHKTFSEFLNVPVFLLLLGVCCFQTLQHIDVNFDVRLCSFNLIGRSCWPQSAILWKCNIHKRKHFEDR